MHQESCFQISMPNCLQLKTRKESAVLLKWVITRPELRVHYSLETIEAIGLRIQKTKMNGESANLTSKYIIDCTEEQAIVSGKARVKVHEAKMSRFMGFMSPRILMRKIVDFSNDNESSELVESEKDFDIVNKKEKYLKRRSLKFQSKDRVVLSL